MTAPTVSVSPETSASQDRPVVPVVLATIPADLGQLLRGDVQIAVHHRAWGVEVDVRPATGGTWTPLQMAGGLVVTRPS